MALWKIGKLSLPLISSAVLYMQFVVISICKFKHTKKRTTKQNTVDAVLFQRIIREF